MTTLTRHRGNPLSSFGRDLGRFPLLSEERERKLAVAAWQGDTEARDTLIVSNLPLVAWVAREDRFQGYGVPLDDRVADGNLGLIKAASKFDPSFGSRFTTYAVRVIRSAIGQGIMGRHLVRLPHSVIRIVRVGSGKGKGEREGDGRSTRWAGCATAARRIMEEGVRSLDVLGLGETIPAEADESMELAEEAAAVLPALSGALGCLDDREADVIRSHYGLDGRDAETLEKIGKRHEVSRERIRQIELVALAKLRGELERSLGR